MHIQIRSAPVKSPADLEEFLSVLEQEAINIVAAGGSDVERGGEFAFAVAHGEEDHAIEVLEAAGYQPRRLEVDSCWLTNEPGQLRKCIADVRARNREKGWIIEDISIGVPNEEGEIPVQIYSIAAEPDASAS